jgi:transposase
MDMRAGTETTFARVVKVFGAARPHHAYVFANRRLTRLKVVVHNGIGIWLAARRLHQGRFIWPGGGCGAPNSITHGQLHSLVLVLPWQRVGEAGVITLV